MYSLFMNYKFCMDNKFCDTEKNECVNVIILIPICMICCCGINLGPIRHRQSKDKGVEQEVLARTTIDLRHHVMEKSFDFE